MKDRRGIGVGIVGMGFMGRTHLAAYDAARRGGLPCEVVAVCDRHPERRAACPGARGYEDPAGLFADPGVDLVSICTPTDSHVELAIRALEGGKHVLVEKPVALLARDVARVAEAASRAGRACMPALCMRFWPGWDWLAARIDAGTFGPVRSARFERLVPIPSAGRRFYEDHSRSGGALFDLHIHDADLVRWCFGDPEAVSSGGTRDHGTTLYRFGGGPAHVAAEWGWDPAPGFPFRMRYTVVFAGAAADFDLRRDPPLLLARGGACEPVGLRAATGYEGEIRHVVAGILEGDAGSLAVTMEDAAGVTRLLEAESRSLTSGAVVRVKGWSA